MDNIKNLTEEDLDKTVGGEILEDGSICVDGHYPYYGTGCHVEVHTTWTPIHQFTSGGTITKVGHGTLNGNFSFIYYVKCIDDPEDSGWYAESYIADYTCHKWEKFTGNVIVDSSIE